MTGMETLLLLLLISSIPVVAVLFWFRLSRYPFTFPMFAVSLLAGAVSVFPALLLQHIITERGFFNINFGKWDFFAYNFIHIALTEELGRLIMLIILFLLFRRFFYRGSVEITQGEEAPETADSRVYTDTMACAAGLIAGFGFAVIESAVYGASDASNTLLRAFTAAPLHGACGARVGVSIAMFTRSPGRAVSRFLIAVALHGIYNIMLGIPGLLTSAAAVLIAVSALASSILMIRNGMKEISA